MKRIIPLLLAAVLVLPLGAEELHKPNRVFEIGFDTDFGISNNYFKPEEIMVKNLVIDLSKMSSSISKEGLSLGDSLDVQFNMNLNIGTKFRLGFFTGVEGYGIGNISKELFDLLGKGNEGLSTTNITSSLNQDVFFKIGGTFASKIGRFQFKVTPTVFSPIMHVENSNSRAEITYPDDGGVKAVASTDVLMYSVFTMNELKANKFEYTEFMNRISKGYGFDLGTALEFPLFEVLQIGISSRIPIVPGKLYNKGKSTASAVASVGNVADLMAGKKAYDLALNYSDFAYTKETYYISRPLKINADVAWQPFGKWFTLASMVGLGVKYPFTDKAIAYPEYMVGLRLKAGNILGLTVSTNYMQQIFIQEALLSLNVRVVQINLGASFQSTDFVKSFSTCGAGAKVSFYIGF